MKKILFSLALFPVLLFLAANAYILSYSRFIITDSSLIPDRHIALVFGGGMKTPTEMNDMQTDRVIRAIELYKSGKVRQIMFTGDDGFVHGDEVGAMRQYALLAGIPPEAILADTHGYRTYESCFRGHEVFGLTSTIAISQEFHLARIAYLCQRMGIDTVGVTADLRDYGWHLHRMQLREFLARFKAAWQMEISKPQPITLEK